MHPRIIDRINWALNENGARVGAVRLRSKNRYFNNSCAASTIFSVVKP